jgi:hypothetical protein
MKLAQFKLLEFNHEGDKTKRKKNLEDILIQYLIRNSVLNCSEYVSKFVSDVLKEVTFLFLT